MTQNAPVPPLKAPLYPQIHPMALLSPSQFEKDSGVLFNNLTYGLFDRKFLSIPLSRDTCLESDLFDLVCGVARACTLFLFISFSLHCFLMPRNLYFRRGPLFILFVNLHVIWIQSTWETTVNLSLFRSSC
jgi:hypothetical protein